MSNIKDEKRLQFLDGMRGVAIVLVILFHAYARWPDLYPYGDQFGNFPLFKYGWIGVELFFLISGFVILMTLEKCSSFLDFMLRRWFRLFPAMLACSVFIFLTTGFFYERPAGIPGYPSLISGLIFIEPEVLEKILERPLGGLEASFWSLYTEVKFYFIFGLLYWFFGKRLAIIALLVLFAIHCGVTYYPSQIPYLNVFTTIKIYTDAEYFGWFASGAVFYEFYKTRNIYLLILAILIGIILMLFKGFYIGGSFVGTLVVLFFASSLFSNALSLRLSCKALTFLGFISYPLYLIHENMMVSLIVKFGNTFPYLNSIALPLLPISAIIVIGAFFAYFLEPFTKRLVKPIYQTARVYLVPNKN